MNPSPTALIKIFSDTQKAIISRCRKTVALHYNNVFKKIKTKIAGNPDVLCSHFLIHDITTRTAYATIRIQPSQKNSAFESGQKSSAAWTFSAGRLPAADYPQGKRFVSDPDDSC
jgi:hypothetical protein